MSKIGMREMLEAGAHFGHQTRKWNPKMQKFIFGPRNGIHIIDLQQTVGMLRDAYSFVTDSVAKGGKVLFVGTKKQAQEIIAEEAARSGQYWVNNRWLGGMLTNFKTIKQSVDRFREIEQMAQDGTFEKLPKKEVIQLTRELAKLEKNLSGIKDMTKMPKVIFIVDPNREHIAVDEAKKLEIPVVATVDTNCNPELIDFPIPANDDSLRSIKLFVSNIADACIEGNARHEEFLAQKKASGEAKAEAEDAPKKSKKKQGPQVEIVHQMTAAVQNGHGQEDEANMTEEFGMDFDAKGDSHHHGTHRA